MLESLTLSHLVSQRQRFVVSDYEQAYREMNDFFVSVVNSEQCSHLREDKNSEFSQTSNMELLEE